MLQRDIYIGADLLVCRDSLKQSAGDLVGICVQKPHPAQVFDGCKFLQQQRQSVFQTEVFAVASRVLADESDLAHARSRQSLGFGDD